MFPATLNLTATHVESPLLAGQFLGVGVLILTLTRLCIPPPPPAPQKRCKNSGYALSGDLEKTTTAIRAELPLEKPGVFGQHLFCLWGNGFNRIATVWVKLAGSCPNVRRLLCFSSFQTFRLPCTIRDQPPRCVACLWRYGDAMPLFVHWRNRQLQPQLCDIL